MGAMLGSGATLMSKTNLVSLLLMLTAKKKFKKDIK